LFVNLVNKGGYACRGCNLIFGLDQVCFLGQLFSFLTRDRIEGGNQWIGISSTHGVPGRVCPKDLCRRLVASVCDVFDVIPDGKSGFFYV